MKEKIVERRIMWGDLDSLGIVFYPRFYEWMDASGHLFFDAVGLNLGELWDRRHILFGLVKTSCTYHRPGRYHQKIAITTTLDDLAEKTLTLRYMIRDVPSGDLMAEGYENRICLDVSDLNNFRAIPIPDDILAILKHAVEGSEPEPCMV